MAWRNRLLILRLAKREIESRYRGSLLGLAWSVLVPLMMLVIYTFVFSIVFQARWDTPISSRGEFAMLIFSGLIAFNFFAECIIRAPGLMLENVSYIKKVIFPLETLPWVIICVALFNAFVSFLVLAIFYAFLRGMPPLSAIFLPLLLIPLVLLSLGFTCFISSFGVFVRDLRQFTGVLTTIIMFMSPVFYPISSVPAKLQKVLYLNPLTILLETSKDLLFWGRLPNETQFTILLCYLLASWLFCWAGYVWLMKTKKGFADVV
jgi:lipopolysaccharide transport system permease protein